MRKSVSVIRRRRKSISVFIAIFIVISVILLISMSPDIWHIRTETTDTFGDDDSQLMETGEFDGKISGSSATLPKNRGSDAESASNEQDVDNTTVFQDGFESGNFSKWDDRSDSYSLKVTDQESSAGNYSAKFHHRLYVFIYTIYLKKNLSVSIGSNEHLHIEFDANVHWIFDNDTIELIGNYFALRFRFSNGKSLVYVFAGIYKPSENDYVVDIRDQVTNFTEWCGISIQNIQNDYETKIGGEMPEQFAAEFRCRSFYGKSYIDNVCIVKETKPEPSGYWEDEDGNEIEAYYVNVDFKVDVSDDINKSDVWLEIKLYTTIQSDGSIVKDRSFVYTEFVPIYVFNEWINWSSAHIPLPEDSSYGDELNYTIDVYVKAYGSINGTEEWTTAEAEKKNFDSFMIYWTEKGGINLIIATAGFGSFGIIGAIAVRRKKKKKTNVNATRII